MSVQETREQWERFWVRTDAETKAEKASHVAIFELSQRYLSLPTDEREVVNAILAEWVLSDDPSKRFDALALIDEHRISSALPALRELRKNLERSTGPGAPYERAKVDRIVAAITGV